MDTRLAELTAEIDLEKISIEGSDLLFVVQNFLMVDRMVFLLWACG